MFVPDLNPKSTMIKNPRLPQGVVPLLLVVHYFPYEHGTFWVVSDTPKCPKSQVMYIYIYTPPKIIDHRISIMFSTVAHMFF